MSLLEVLAVITSAVGVWLTTRRLVLAWPVVLVACALYAAVFRDARLYSDMLLQGVYAVFAVYGWFQWRRGMRAGSVTVRLLPLRGWLLGFGVGAALSLVLGWSMHRYTNAALPWMDSALTSFSLVAQLWSARRYTANWPLWIVVDLVYAGVFVFKHLYLTAALYALFVGLAIAGARAWQAAYREQAAALLSKRSAGTMPAVL